jgi:hypothetical protein
MLFSRIERHWFLLLDDLSKDKDAIQSKTRLCSPTSQCLAKNAVDRIYSTCMNADAFGILTPYKTMWWSVDLGAVYSIYSINVVFKDYVSTSGDIHGKPTQSILFQTLINHSYRGGSRNFFQGGPTLSKKFHPRST